jgi:hypothetical protein
LRLRGSGFSRAKREHIVREDREKRRRKKRRRESNTGQMGILYDGGAVRVSDLFPSGGVFA